MRIEGVNPFEERIDFVRGNKPWTLVLGIDDEGEGYIEFHEQILYKGAIQTRWVPTKVWLGFERKNGRRVTNNLIESYWRSEKYIDGEFIEGTEGPEIHLTTNKPDKILFTPQLGVPIMFAMAGGFVRKVLGFDDQPLFSNGVRIPDTEYDVTLPPTNTYDSHLPELTSTSESEVGDGV